MEVIKEALIKECGNMYHDKVFIVENLPKKFLYERTAKLIHRVDKEGNRDGYYTPDPNGETEYTLLPGIEMSQTGDGGYVFWKGVLESENRLKDLDRFIERSLPRDMRIPARIVYAQQTGNPSSPPIPVNQIPRVQLPAPVEPVVAAPVVPVAVAVAAVAGQIKDPVVVDAKPITQSERMKKYWEDKRTQAQARTAN